MLYFIAWVCALNLTQWFYLWLSLEALNWLLFLLLTSPLIFLFWQSLSSLLLIYSWVILENNFFLFFCVILKTGMIPFSIFVLKMEWKWSSWLLFLTLHKLPPFLLLVLISNTTFFFLFWAVGGMYYLYQNSSMFNMMWMSGLSESAWLCLPLNLTKMCTFFIFYSCSWLIWAKVHNLVSFKTNSTNSMTMFILTLALPPSLMFFMKIFIWMNLSALMGYLLAFVSWFMIFIYFKWLILNLNLASTFCETLNLWVWNYWLISGHLSFFFMW